MGRWTQSSWSLWCVTVLLVNLLRQKSSVVSLGGNRGEGAFTQGKINASFMWFGFGYLVYCVLLSVVWMFFSWKQTCFLRPKWLAVWLPKTKVRLSSLQSVSFKLKGIVRECSCINHHDNSITWADNILSLKMSPAPSSCPPPPSLRKVHSRWTPDNYLFSFPMKPQQPSTLSNDPPPIQGSTRRPIAPHYGRAAPRMRSSCRTPPPTRGLPNPSEAPHRGTHAHLAGGSLTNVLLFPPHLPSGSRPPSQGPQHACAVARAAGCGEGLKSAGHAQRRFWLWRGGRHIGSARGALRAAAGRYGARLAGPHAAAPGPRVAPLRARRAEASGCAVSGRRRGALAGPWGSESGGRGWIPAWPGSSPSRKAPRMRSGCRSGRPRRAWGAAAAAAPFRTTSASTPRRWTRPPPSPRRPAATAALGSGLPAAAAAPRPRRRRPRRPPRRCWPDWCPPPAPRRRWTAAVREGGGCRSRPRCLPRPPARRWSPAPRAPASPPRGRAAAAAAPPLPPAAPGRRWLLPGCRAAVPGPGSSSTSTRTAKRTARTGTTRHRTSPATPTHRRRLLPSSTSTTRAAGNERIRPAPMAWITCSPAAAAWPSPPPRTSSVSRPSPRCRAPAPPGRAGSTARACRGEWLGGGEGGEAVGWGAGTELSEHRCVWQGMMTSRRRSGMGLLSCWAEKGSVEALLQKSKVWKCRGSVSEVFRSSHLGRVFFSLEELKGKGYTNF